MIAIERVDVDHWLNGTVAQAQQLLQLTPVALFVAGSIAPPASLFETA